MRPDKSQTSLGISDIEFLRYSRYNIIKEANNKDRRLICGFVIRIKYTLDLDDDFGAKVFNMPVIVNTVFDDFTIEEKLMSLFTDHFMIRSICIVKACFHTGQYKRTGDYCNSLVGFFSALELEKTLTQQPLYGPRQANLVLIA